MPLKKNVLANFAGSAWSALMGLAFVPFYIHLMGVEAYGVIGVFFSLQAVLSIFDLGLSQSMNREMARLSADRSNASRMADTARTLEISYWAIAIAVVLVIILLSNFIAYHWLNSEHLTRQSLEEALWIMAVVIGLRWPSSLYTGGLNGLQRQVVVNKLIIFFSTLQGAGAVIVLEFVEPTLRAFFVWQAVVALLQFAVLRIVFRRCLINGSHGIFRKDVFIDIWRFAAGMSALSVVGLILLQLDKVLLSRMLTLAEFGYYTFATTVASILYKFIGPIFVAYSPRFTELVSRGNETELIKLYHQGSQLLAVFIFPAALTVAFFSKEIIEFWTHNAVLVEHTHLLVSLLVIGNALYGVMHMPYALQLAYGRTALSFYSNLIAVIILGPAIYFLATYWGAIGAAIVWLVLNISYVLFVVLVMHRDLLVHEKWHWYLNDLGKPLISALMVVLVGRMMMEDDFGAPQKIGMLIAIYGLSTIAAVVAASFLRSKLFSLRFGITKI